MKILAAGTAGLEFSYYRIAATLTIAAAVWDALWLVRGSVFESSPLVVIIATTAHAASLVVFALRRARSIILLMSALALSWTGFQYFYVVWPAAALILIASLVSFASTESE